MWPLVIPFLTSIFGKDGPVGQWLTTKQQQAQAKADLDLQIEKDKLQLTVIMAQAAVDSERNKLAATSQTFKAISFFLLNVPIIITCLSDNRGKMLWDNLSAVPVWYAQLYVSVVFVIWGLPVVANATGTIFNAIQQAWGARNQGKIAKIQALGEANGLNTEQATKQIFDIMRKTMGAVSQAQVNAADPLIKSFVDGLKTTTAVISGDNTNAK